MEDQDKMEAILKKANFLLSRNKLTEALKYFEEAEKEVTTADSSNLSLISTMKGICWRRLGNTDVSMKCFQRAISLNGNDYLPYNQIALMCKDSLNYNEAINWFKKVLSLSVDFVEAKENIAIVLTDNGTKVKQAGNIDLGMDYYLQAISYNPKYAPAYYNIGVIYSELGKFKEALEYYFSAIEYNPSYVEAYCNIGVIFKKTNRLEEAIEYYQKSLNLNPNFTIARSNMAIAKTDLGTKLKNEGKLRDGVKQYKEALTFDPHYADAYYNLGVAYSELLMFDKSVVYYSLAIHFNPNCFEAYNNLGVIYKDKNNFEKATYCYKQALLINPKFSASLNNLGVVYTVQGKLEDAFTCIKQSIEVNPHYSEAYNNLGVLHRDEGNIHLAVECYEKSLYLQPLSRNAGQNRLLALNYLPDLGLDKLFKDHKAWGTLFEQQFVRTTKHSNKKDPNKQIRIGYLSADFFTHSVSYFIEAILANHSDEKFYIICYSNVVKEDNKTAILKQLAHAWRPIYGYSPEQVAKLVSEDEVDILVDLTGHTAGNRLDVMAIKPAPIQVTYIGYPNTTGMTAIDYRFSDETSDSLNTEQKYTEELVRLPRCFLCYTPSRDVGPVAPTPALANGFVTFGSFNNLAKMNPKVFKLWATIMKLVPDSRLVLKGKSFTSSSLQKKYFKLFESLGINEERIDLLGLLPNTIDHLAAYQLMDISLDTFPYAGTTTTCESLYMGVPVVTLKGNCHAQNVGASLLTQISYTDWIADTEEEYVQFAVRLSSNIQNLEKIRSTLRQRMRDSYLMDGKSFTHNLENTYRSIWSKYCLKKDT